MSSKKNDDTPKDKDGGKKRKGDSESSKDKEKEKEKEEKKPKKDDAPKRNHNGSKHSDDENESKDSKASNEKTSPFDSGLEPEKIIGATDINGELAFLVQWKNSTRAMLIPSKLARQKCPQLVIDFYEQRLAWHTE